MVVWFGPTQLSEIYIESPNYKNGAFGLLLTQNSNTGPLFSELKLVKVKDIFSLTKLLFLYDFINDYVPEELKTIFIIKIPTHSYETHSSMVFHIPKAKTWCFGLNILCYDVANLWNKFYNPFLYKEPKFTKVNLKKLLQMYFLDTGA